jgi:4'-phosphopantetheinyl transferase
MTGIAAALVRIQSPIPCVDIWHVPVIAGGRNTNSGTDWMLQRVISNYLRVAPENVEIVRGSTGKPCLGTSSTPREVHFSFTDSGRIALIAVAMDRQVGIDVEQIRFRVDLNSLIDKAATPAERAHLLVTTGPAQRQLFNRYWVRKEAYLKAIGTGLTFPMNRVDVSLSFAQRDQAVTVPVVDGQRVSWTIYDVPLPGTEGLAVASLAVEGFSAEHRTVRDARLPNHNHSAYQELTEESIQ